VADAAGPKLQSGGMRAVAFALTGFVFAVVVSRLLRLTDMPPRFFAAVTLPVIAVLAYPGVKGQVKMGFAGWVALWTACAIGVFVAQGVWP
jgi:hypothetical protein